MDQNSASWNQFIAWLRQLEAIRHLGAWGAQPRSWTKVHSQLSQRLDRRSVKGSHIRDHVMREIETDWCIGEDRPVYSNPIRWPSKAFSFIASRVHG